MIRISVCRCGHYDIPTLDRCVHCGQPVRVVDLEARGRVLTWTILHHVPEGLPRPLRLFLVELANGMKMLCRGPEACETMGQTVRVREEQGIFHCEPWNRWAETKGRTLHAVANLWKKIRPLSVTEKEAARRARGT